LPQQLLCRLVVNMTTIGARLPRAINKVLSNMVLYLRHTCTPLGGRPAKGLNQEDLIGFLPLDLALAAPWQLPLQLQGV
jgi:hypothetical protein